MFATCQENVSAGVTEDNANERERSVDVNVQGSCVGNAVKNANPCPFYLTVRVLGRPTVTWSPKRGDNQGQDRSQKKESISSVTRDVYPCPHQRLPRNRTKETRRSGRRVS
jgi:hypothetical protein